MQYLIIIWVILLGAASVVSIGILQRRGMDGMPFVLAVGLGAAGAYFITVPMFFVIGIASLLVFGAGCLGLMPKRIKPDRCPNCDYDLHGVEETSSARCPECGTPRPSMVGHCMECKKDIRSAIAGGTDRCPFCKAPVEVEER